MFGGLNVAVDDSFRVGSVQALCDLNRQIENFIDLHRLAEDALLERFPVQVLHGNEVLALKLVDVVNGADIGMIQCRSCLSLALEPLQGVAIFGYLLGQKLEGDCALEFGVLRLVDDPHPSAA
jgi:hypothetical protein